MADNSKIEWTDNTWNPSTGCTKISPGCANCYAETVALKLQNMGQAKYKDGFKYTEHIDVLQLPLKWKKPKKIFVNSMSDLFHEVATDGFITQVFNTMIKANWHTFQVLTKRPERMLEFCENLCNRYKINQLPNNIWLGTTVENTTYLSRLEYLRRMPSQIKFVSFEPLLEDIGYPDLTNIQWAIVGGESGKYHRPINEEWVIKIRESCKQHHTAFFFKQWGGIHSKAGGRELQGKIYSEFPSV